MQRELSKTIVVYLFVLFLLLGSCLSVKAKELVALGAQLSHIFEMTPEGAYVGLSVDILTRLAHRNGDTITFELYPWTRAQFMVEKGRADILIGPYKTEMRASKMSFFNQPFYQDKMVFYRRVGSNVSWNGDYESLLGMHIAKVKGWAYGDEFMAHAASLEVQDFGHLRGAIVRLAQGDIDLVASNVRNTTALLKAMTDSTYVEPITPIITINSGYLAFAKIVSNKDIQAEYEKHFNEIVSSGELAELGLKYGVNTP